jgi:hypothetical protein
VTRTDPEPLALSALDAPKLLIVDDNDLFVSGLEGLLDSESSLRSVGWRTAPPRPSSPLHPRELVTAIHSIKASPRRA